jgi:hypothetical protein
MFGRITESGMRELKERFAKLRDTLIDAHREPDASKACLRLKEVFSNDFPCPDRGSSESKGAMRTSAPAIVTSSSSA